jgi:hypothetical protein
VTSNREERTTLRRARPPTHSSGVRSANVDSSQPFGVGRSPLGSRAPGRSLGRANARASPPPRISMRPSRTPFIGSTPGGGTRSCGRTSPMRTSCCGRSWMIAYPSRSGSPTISPCPGFTSSSSTRALRSGPAVRPRAFRSAMDQRPTGPPADGDAVVDDRDRAAQWRSRAGGVAAGLRGGVSPRRAGQRLRRLAPFPAGPLPIRVHHRSRRAHPPCDRQQRESPPARPSDHASGARRAAGRRLGSVLVEADQ